MRKYQRAAAASKGSIFSPEWKVIYVRDFLTDGAEEETEELTMAHRTGVVLLTGIYSGQC